MAKRRETIVLLLGLFSVHLLWQNAFAATYFVRTNGTNRSSSSGVAQPFGTISYAVHRANPGDTIRVEAGDYNIVNDLAKDADGHPDAEYGYWDSDGIAIDDSLTIIGYNSQVGDLDQGEGVPNGYNSNTSLTGQTVVSMPTITGLTRNANDGIYINAPSVHIKNLKIQSFERGVVLKGNVADNCTLMRLILANFGNINQNLDGYGIHMGSDNNEIRDCYITNAVACGIRISSDGSMIFGTKLFADEKNPDDPMTEADESRSSNAPMDYYIELTAGASENLVMDCVAERYNSIPHAGHGRSDFGPRSRYIRKSFSRF